MKTAPGLLCLLATAWTAAHSPDLAVPDLLPIGHRGVVHELVLEDSELLGQFRLVAGPTRGFGGLAEIDPGVPFRFSSKYGTRIYALPLDEPLPAESPALGRFPAGWPEEFLTGSIPVLEVRSVPVLSSVHRILTTLRITGVDEKEREIGLKVTAEQRWDRRGRPITWASIPILSVLALAGLAGIALLARTRPSVSVEGS